MLGLLYVLIAIFRVAHEPPRNVLIAETFPHQYWKQGYARTGAWTELGWVIGLLLGYLFAFIGAESAQMLLASAFLSLLSFLASAIFVRDPALIIERGLVSIEKSIMLLEMDEMLLSKIEAGITVRGELKRENVIALCTGLVLFALATSMFSTPLPIFFARNIALHKSSIFILFLLNSTSCSIGYFLIQRKTYNSNQNNTMEKVVLLRILLALLPLFTWVTSFIGVVALSIIALVGMGLTNAFYSISAISLSMEVIPRGKAGLFTTLVGIGSAIGCLAGPLIAESLGFQYAFVASGAFFLLGFVSFKKF